jgi:hypothetical protein
MFCAKKVTKLPDLTVVGENDSKYLEDQRPKLFLLVIHKQAFLQNPRELSILKSFFCSSTENKSGHTKLNS